MTMTVPARRNRYGPMSRTGRDPVHQVDTLYTLMNQLFADVMPDTGGMWIIPADIEETEDGYLVEAEVPGVDRDDLDISLRDTELRISGEVKEREREGILRRRTRRVGRFELVIDLPGPVDPDRVAADLHDGLLTIMLRKPEGTRDRHIEVRGAGDR
jgi:HSP20 family protein